ncbi:HAD hydrolase family protein, partial [Salmonella enterica subsp. enterica serovar Cerro]|nr:HAD hydrolase family protein [Salmonella enterica subsp. enterica serovar Cerro]
QQNDVSMFAAAGISIAMGNAPDAVKRQAGYVTATNDEEGIVHYGKTVRVRTAMGSVKAAKLLWACDSFLNNLEPEIYKKTLVTY